MKEETKQLIAFYITCIAVAIIVILFSASCKKKEVLPEYKVQYKAYAKVVPYSVSYTNAELNIVTEEVNTNNWSKDVIINYETNVNINIKNKALSPIDSVSISVSCNAQYDHCNSKLNNAWSLCNAGFKIKK